MSSLVTGILCLVLPLNQRRSLPLRLQTSHCMTFRIMCDVPNTALFCSESSECFRGTASRFLFKSSVTVPVAPIITDIIIHFMFQIRCTSVHKLLYIIYLFFFFTVSPCILILSRPVFIQLNAQLHCSRKLLKRTLKCSYMFWFNSHHQGAYCDA